VRRLTAILFSDIHGFSRQMSVDEQGMLARLADHNRIFREQIGVHGGRVVKGTGDGFMVEFQSAVAAVDCGLHVQQALARRALGHPEQPAIAVRIGVHLGDVEVSAEGDLFGDAVNIAARLEQICPVGSVCVSHAVYEQTRGKINADGEALGHVRLKNIARKVRVYVLHPSDDRLTISGILPKLAAPTPASPWKGRRRLLWAAVAVAGVLVAGWVVYRELAGSGPTRSGVLRIASSLERGQLRPYSVFHGLYRSALDEVLEPLIPSVLESWQERNEGLQWVLTLGPEVRFHDHPCLPEGRGREAGPADLVYSLEVALRHGGNDLPIRGRAEFLAGQAARLKGLTVEGSGQVVMDLEWPSAFAQEQLASVLLVPADLKGCTDPGQPVPPVGSAPFRFTRAPTSDDLVLERFDRARQLGSDGRPLPYVDRVELRHEPDVADALSRLGRGELEVVILSRAQAENVVEVVRDRARLKGSYAGLDAAVATNVLQGITFAGLYLTGRAGPLESRATRQALSKALDRERIIEALGGGALPSARFLDPRMLGASPQLTSLAPDPQAAEALLAGGQPSGPVLIGHTAERRAACEQIAGDAAKARLQLQCVELSLEGLADNQVVRTVDAFLSFSPYELYGTEPWPYLSAMGFSADARDQPSPPPGPLLEELQRERDRQVRTGLYRQLEELLLESLSIIPIGVGRNTLDSYQAYWVIRRGVEGLWDPTTGRVVPDGQQRLSRTWVAP